MSEVNYTEQNPLITRGGRKLWRHPNGEGCVLEFDMYGKIVQLYVPDAKFREIAYKILSNNSPLGTQLNSQILEFDSTSNGYYIVSSHKYASQAFTETEFLTDSQLQNKLDSFLTSGTFANDLTAQTGTDAIYNNLYDSLVDPIIRSPAAVYVRSIIPSGLRACNIPNIYELSVIWLESDNIDSIDPTVVDYSAVRLGYPSRFRQNNIWSCSEVKVGNFLYGLGFSNGGTVYKQDRNGANANWVLPVLELSIKDAPKHKLITKVVVVDKGEAYETKGVSLGESEVLTTLTSLVQKYQNTYDELNQKVTALETKYNQGRVKIVESMMELKNNPEENLLYINDEVKAIVDNGSGIIPKAYISDGSEVTLKEVERKEEDPDDGNEYIGYVNKAEIV